MQFFHRDMAYIQTSEFKWNVRYSTILHLVTYGGKPLNYSFPSEY